MATLKAAAVTERPEAKLLDRDPRAWLTSAEIDTMRKLLNEIEAEPQVFVAWALRKQAYALFAGSWFFSGPFDALLSQWSEERRCAACVAWARQGDGRSLRQFGPFETRHAIWL